MKVTPRPLRLLFVLALLFLPFAGPAAAQTTPVLIDGAFDDWSGRTPAHADARGDAGPDGVDLGRLWLANDQRYLFLAFETGDTLSLQNANDLRLLLDTDLNAQTGLQAAGLGAELVWHFGRRKGQVYVGEAVHEVGHHTLGLVSAPTITSDRFEIALRRDARIDGQPLFPGDSVRVALISGDDGDRLPDAGGAVTYAFEPAAQTSLPAVALAKPHPALLRMMSYNVLRDRLFDDEATDAYRRLFQALQPDLIGFQEIYDHSAEATAARVAEWLPDGRTWHSAKADPDIVVVSRHPIQRADTIDGNGAFLIDTEAVLGQPLLFIVAHTPCCDRDADRQAEIDRLMAYVRHARAEGLVADQTPIILTGDLNLVGDARQVRTLVTGDIVDNAAYGPDFAPDADGTALTDLAPMTTGLPMNVTWYDPESSFGPGRLDYAIYTDALLNVANAFVLFTPGLGEAALQAYGLQADDTLTASDHLPLVIDIEAAAADATR